jgi:histidinol phosphatase-like enzyme
LGTKPIEPAKSETSLRDDCHSVQREPRHMQAVRLDRDGVINALVYHVDAGVIDAPFKPSQFKLLPRVPLAIRSLNRLGLWVAVVSDQQ